MNAERIAALIDLAAHHERQALFHAKTAAGNATWYCAHEADTRRSAEHFAVAAALRTLLERERDG